MGVFSALLCSRCGGLRQALVEVAGFAEDNVYLMTSQMSGRKEPTHVNGEQAVEFVIRKGESGGCLHLLLLRSWNHQSGVVLLANHQ